METHMIPSQLQEEIQGNFTDVRAETLLCMAMEKGLGKEDYAPAFDGLFSRPYKRDILRASLEEDANHNEFVELHLSRNGLYDLLPEGLFHQPPTPKNSRSVQNMSEEYRENRQKEAETRRFFKPLEKAFFDQRLQLEMEETGLMRGMGTGLLNDHFMDFWGVSDRISAQFRTSLICLLPHIQKITGRVESIAQSLEGIIHEKVEIKRADSKVSGIGCSLIPSLGGARLGNDTVLGDESLEIVPKWEFHIGPLENSRVQDYLDGGSRLSFLETFYGFFTPVEVVSVTKIVTDNRKLNMTLGVFDGAVLGHSSALVDQSL